MALSSFLVAEAQKLSKQCFLEAPRSAFCTAQRKRSSELHFLSIRPSSIIRDFKEVYKLHGISSFLNRPRRALDSKPYFVTPNDFQLHEILPTGAIVELQSCSSTPFDETRYRMIENFKELERSRKIRYVQLHFKLYRRSISLTSCFKKFSALTDVFEEDFSTNIIFPNSAGCITQCCSVRLPLKEGVNNVIRIAETLLSVNADDDASLRVELIGLNSVACSQYNGSGSLRATILLHGLIGHHNRLLGDVSRFICNGSASALNYISPEIISGRQSLCSELLVPHVAEVFALAAVGSRSKLEIGYFEALLIFASLLISKNADLHNFYVKSYARVARSNRDLALEQLEASLASTQLLCWLPRLAALIQDGQQDDEAYKDIFFNGIHPAIKRQLRASRALLGYNYQISLIAEALAASRSTGASLSSSNKTLSASTILLDPTMLLDTATIASLNDEPLGSLSLNAPLPTGALYLNTNVGFHAFDDFVSNPSVSAIPFSIDASGCRQLRGMYVPLGTHGVPHSPFNTALAALGATRAPTPHLGWRPLILEARNVSSRLYPHKALQNRVDTTWELLDDVQLCERKQNVVHQGVEICPLYQRVPEHVHRISNLRGKGSSSGERVFDLAMQFDLPRGGDPVMLLRELCDVSELFEVLPPVLEETGFDFCFSELRPIPAAGEENDPLTQKDNKNKARCSSAEFSVAHNVPLHNSTAGVDCADPKISKLTAKFVTDLYKGKTSFNINSKENKTTFAAQTEEAGKVSTKKEVNQKSDTCVFTDGNLMSIPPVRDSNIDAASLIHRPGMRIPVKSN